MNFLQVVCSLSSKATPWWPLVAQGGVGNGVHRPRAQPWERVCWDFLGSELGSSSQALLKKEPSTYRWPNGLKGIKQSPNRLPCTPCVSGMWDPGWGSPEEALDTPHSKDTRDKSFSRGDSGTWGGCRICVPSCRAWQALHLFFQALHLFFYTFSSSPAELASWSGAFCLFFSPFRLQMTQKEREQRL